ncbi:MAG: AsmA family protein [Telmatospirillum sp.]|nr:AsmA family protein [Telmatospirillum sp.]
MRILKWVAIGLVGLVVVAVAGVFIVASSIDPNQYKPQIVEAAKNATGRDLALKGDIKLSIGLSPSFGIADVTFANAAWGSRPEMVKVGRFEVQVALLPLLSKQIEIKRLVLADTDILLETDAAGRGNWEFQTAAPAPTQPNQAQPAQGGAASGPLPVVREVELRNARFAYRDGKTRETQEIKLERILVNADGAADPLRLDIAGSVNVPALAGEQKFTLKGQVGSVERALQTVGRPYPVDLSFAVGDNVLTGKLAGGIVAPTKGQGYTFDLMAEIPEVQKLAALAKQEIPALGPLKLTLKVADSGPSNRLSLPEIKIEFGKADTIKLDVAGAFLDPLEQRGLNVAVRAVSTDMAAPFRAARMEPAVAGPLDLQLQLRDTAAARYQLSNLKLAAGPQNAVDLSGEATLANPPGGKPSVQANLRSTSVDLVKLFPPKPASAQAARPAAPAATTPSDGRVIPNEKVPFELLNSANADLRYAADSIVTEGATLRSLNLQLVVNNGQLTLRPLTFDMDGGKFAIETTANAAQKGFTQKVEMRNLDVGRVLNERKLNDWFKGGLTSFDLNLRGQGETARGLAATLQGDVFLNMGPGELGQAATRVIGDWLAKVAPPLAALNIGTSVRCGIHKIDFQNGVGTYKAGLIDTGIMSARTSGSFDLRTEQLNLNQVAGPVAVLIRGTFANSSVIPDPAGTAQALLSGGAGAVTGIVGGAGSIVGGLLGGGQRPAAAPAQAAPSASNACAQALAAATGRPAPAQPASAPASQPAPAQAAPAPAPSGGIQVPGIGRLPFGR